MSSETVTLKVEGVDKEVDVVFVLISGKKYYLPFLNEIPISIEDHDELKRSIKEEGKVLQPVVTWAEMRSPTQEWVIDGANRCLIAGDLGLTAVPIRQQGAKDFEDARRIGEELNLSRRHDEKAAAEHQKARAVNRLAAVAELAAEGKSTRTIAKQVGISQTHAANLKKKVQAQPSRNGHAKRPSPPPATTTATPTPEQVATVVPGEVEREHQCSREPDCPEVAIPEAVPEFPARVQGADGNTYPAKKPREKTKPDNSPKKIKERAADAIGVIVRALDSLGLHDEFRPTLDLIAEAIAKA